MTARLAMVVPVFPRLSETFLVNKFLGLLERGWDVHVIARPAPDDEWQRFPRLAERALRERVHASWPTSPSTRALKALPAAARTFVRHAPAAIRSYRSDAVRAIYTNGPVLALRPDIVHFEFGSAAVGRVAIKDLIDTRCVVSFRGHDVNHVGLEDPTFYDDVWRRADAIHCLGEHVWEAVRERGCPDDVPHALIPPAIELSPLLAMQPRRAGRLETIRLLSVGRLYWTKGHEYTLGAIQALAAMGIRCELRIVGGGDYREAVRFAAHQLGVADRVELVGPLSPEHVRDELEWADVFVHSAVTEGFCNAVIEAQAAALPVVCSDAGGLPENVADARTGFVVGRRDPHAMASRIAQLATDGDLRARLGAAARERAVQLFALPLQIDAFDRLYRDVMSRDAR